MQNVPFLTSVLFGLYKQLLLILTTQIAIQYLICPPNINEKVTRHCYIYDITVLNRLKAFM